MIRGHRWQDDGACRGHGALFFPADLKDWAAQR